MMQGTTLIAALIWPKKRNSRNKRFVVNTVFKTLIKYTLGTNGTPLTFLNTIKDIY